MKKYGLWVIAVLLTAFVSLVPAEDVGCTNDGRKTVIEGMVVCAGAGICVLYEE